MERGDSNTYRFYCEVVEVINTGETPSIKMVCKPGSMIIQMPYDQKIKLGDKFLVTGELKLMSAERDNISEAEYIPKI